MASESALPVVGRVVAVCVGTPLQAAQKEPDVVCYALLACESLGSIREIKLRVVHMHSR